MRTFAKLVLIFGALSVAQAAVAADQPLIGKKLILKRHGATQRLVFVSNDPALLFPVPGGADDPGTGTPGGATIEIFSENEGTVTIQIPTGLGKPGWKTTTGTRPKHKYTNPSAPGGPTPFKSALIQQQKRLTMTARSAGLPMLQTQGAIGIRVTMGGLRNCALFTAPSITRDEVGIFSAKNAAAPADCSDETLSGSGDPPSTCGDSTPTCDGTCGAGEECMATFGGRQCVCLPTGSTPCGNPDAPTCGGACPSGQGCGAVYPPISDPGPVGCACGATGCGNGFAFGIDDFGQGGCFPYTCGGTYPTCGGACGDGGVCSPWKVNPTGSSEFTFCICAVPAPCCGGGYQCGAGDVCSASVTTGCSCAAP